MKIVHIYGVPHGVCFDTWIDYIMFNWVSLPISSNICNFVFMLEHLKSSSILKYILPLYCDLQSWSWAVGCWGLFLLTAS